MAFLRSLRNRRRAPLDFNGHSAAMRIDYGKGGFRMDLERSGGPTAAVESSEIFIGIGYDPYPHYGLCYCRREQEIRCQIERRCCCRRRVKVHTFDNNTKN